MEGRMSREGSLGSTLSSLSLTQSQIEIESIEEDEEHIFEEKVFVAVGKDFTKWKENLRWVLKNTNPDHKIVFLHVHQPATKIPMPLGYFPADRVDQKELQAYRLIEKDKMNEKLKSYIDNCKAYKFRAITQTIDNSDIAKGLIELINMYKVKDLIMGATSDGNLSKAKRDTAPRSKNAIYVHQNADPLCRIRFVCKGELICIREAGKKPPSINNSSRSSSSSSSNNSVNLLHSQSLPPSLAQQILASPPLNQRAFSINAGSSFPSYSEYARSSSAFSEIDNNSTISDSLTTNPYDNSPPMYNMTDDIFTRLKDGLLEIDRLKREALEESSRRGQAELDLVQANGQLRAKESILNTEMKKRSELEECFKKQSNELAKYKVMMDQTMSELNKSNELKNSLESQIRQLEGKVSSLQNKFTNTNSLLTEGEYGSSSQNFVSCSEFSFVELREATNNFDESNKIGEGGFGGVYKGYFRHTPVAIKIMNRNIVRGDDQFYQEVDILSRVRHPHLVTLIGSCLEKRAIVYEFMPRMSLDDHLTYKNRHPPLPWQARVRIAREICSALIFLHSTKPQCIVHGDLKPENVLLDSNYVCKLSDFGICRQMNHTNTTSTPYHLTEHPKGTLPYMDPEYLSSGEITRHCDVFSFGIVLLQLVTGREARNIRKNMVEAAEKDRLGQVVDVEAGKWPFDLAKKMIHLGLWCSEPTRRKRPDLARDVLKVIASMENVAPSVLMKRTVSQPVGSTSRSGSSVPSLFICPLSKEIMMEPQIADDGYTYEAKNIKAWFGRGHNTSPVTNKMIDSYKLVPNITLRCAIQDWLDLRPDLLRKR